MSDAARLHNRACIADADGYHDVAIALWRRCLAMQPEFAEAMVGLGCILFARGEYEEAQSLCDGAVSINDSLAWAWTLAGRLQTVTGHYVFAVDNFNRALSCDPSSAERLFDVSAALFRAGDYEKAWPLHNAANRATWYAKAPSAIEPSLPRWDGRKTDNLLVLPRLGSGDQFMFARFLPWARQRTKRLGVLVGTKEHEIYAPYAAHGIVELVTDISGFDSKIEIYALPELAGTRLDNIPPCAPTLAIIPKSKLKVGICWSGSDDTVTNIIRRVPFEAMLGLAHNPNVELFSLQTGKRSADISQSHAQSLVKDLSAQLEWSWTETANIIQKLDLVIAPDCGLANLAGSMGKPTFVMLSAYPDWRWGVKDTTPWYPSARLFRQGRTGEWRDVINKINETIAGAINEGSSARKSVGQAA